VRVAVDGHFRVGGVRILEAEDLHLLPHQQVWHAFLDVLRSRRDERWERLRARENLSGTETDRARPARAAATRSGAAAERVGAIATTPPATSLGVLGAKFEQAVNAAAGCC